MRFRGDLDFQERNLATGSIALGAAALLLIWWVGFSRARRSLRLGVLLGVVGLLGVGMALFRIRGVTGDLVPILAFRWERTGRPASAEVSSDAPKPVSPVVHAEVPRPDFAQFLGPARTAVLPGPLLGADWAERPPEIRWRRKVGAGWSGFVIVGDRVLTQEQDQGNECVTCYELATGRDVWTHAYAARYDNPVGGEGPRATPTVVDGAVYTLGSTGMLHALDLQTGRVRWSRDLVADTGARMPEWGYAGSPLVQDGVVIVSAGGRDGQSLVAYRTSTGERAWAAGTAAAGYGSPFLTTLAGRRQILAYNHRFITAHDAADGTVLWEYPWGTGQPYAAVPVVAGPNRVAFSAGYGVGTELLEIARDANGTFSAERVWQSRKLKAKFANPVAREGFLYGLDDGLLACLDLNDGRDRWKQGRYGHGQGLLVGDLYLLMAESGELVLLRPTPDGPNELHRFRVFDSKTWNPIALSGDLLLVRNDQEAACLRLPLAPAKVASGH
ncbi:MAG: PQQ-like beta-propeller repeat protein [Opitutaceae bacterium]|nr:PQQ-like beta-propeller repeat protein [Opitutaceae bacterium]